MPYSFFHWIYCLPLPAAIILIAGFTTAYLALKRRFEASWAWKLPIAFLLLLSLAVIAAATLADRTPSSVPLEPELAPLQSYRAVLAGVNKEILRSNFMNVILFYPAGLLACELLPKSWNAAGKVLLVTVLLAAVSVGVEFCQYRFALGQAETDDVIHNTLGALLGGLAAVMAAKKQPREGQRE